MNQPTNIPHGAQRIAVIGAGVAGITAAYLLSRTHQVTLFEKNEYLGGHTNTIEIAGGPDDGLAVDTGFIVLNDRTYPLLHALLSALGVPVRFADMSFSIVCERSGLQYASRSLNALFAQRRNLCSPSFIRMVLEMPRLWRTATHALAHGELQGETVASFLQRHKFSPRVAADYLLPLGAAVWSSPAQGIEAFPAETFFRFFDNHGFLSYADQPRWQTVVGGSNQYVKAFCKVFKGRIVLNAGVRFVRRATSDGGRIEVSRITGPNEEFDQVVLATHADEALALLADASARERTLLGAWRYHKNYTVLHTDVNFLPPLKRAWASWNYRKELGEQGAEPLSITYDMNNLQGFTARERYCVTLNPRRTIENDRVVRTFDYTHPEYTVAAVASQDGIKALNGARNTWFCGSYLGYGFHEDAVRSGVDVAKAFGESL